VEGGAPDGNAAARRSDGDSLSGAAFRGVIYTTEYQSPFVRR